MTHENTIPSATAYFQRIGELLQNTEVTDHSQKIYSVDDGLNLAVEIIETVRQQEGKILVIGNGGSAAIASHLQTDLCHSLNIPAQVFYEPSLLTAISNDNGYDAAFERAMEMWAANSDLLITISSSGRSENIIRACKYCQTLGTKIVTLSGFDEDNTLREYGDLNFYIASHEYGYVEMSHQVIAHCITDTILFKNK